MLKINSETISDPQFPLLIVDDAKESLDIAIIDKEQDEKRVYSSPASINSILTKASVILGINDILDECSYGDELAFPFAVNLEYVDEFKADLLLTQLEEVNEVALSSIDTTISDDIRIELATNMRADLAASFFDALIEQLLTFVVNFAQEINISNIAFTGQLSHIHRAEKILRNGIHQCNMVAHFPDNEFSPE